MTDAELQRRTAICEVAGVAEIDDLSDGFHTFRQLYYQRMMLFAAIVKQNKDKSWKSLRHEDGELCFGGGWFIVGVDTPEGSYTYHYKDDYFSLFDCKELYRAKHWDGHTEKDVTRLLSLSSAQPEEDKLLKKLADALSEKMAYMNMCPNERDVVLGYLGVKRPNTNHCNTDCWQEECKNYHYETRKQPEPCDLCSNLEKGDTLYQSSDWDGGIGFDYIRDIQYCPKCGRRLG